MTEQQQTPETLPTPTLADEAESPAPEWHDEFGEWGHWVDDPEDADSEIWVPLETKETDDTNDDQTVSSGDVQTSDQDVCETQPLSDEKYGKWLNPPPPDPRRTESLERYPERRCTARRTNGKPCRQWAITGATVCRTHGGAAAQVKTKARARLENAADRMAKELLKIAVNDNVPSYVKLDAIKDALDRGGLGAKTAVEVEIGPSKPWEDILSGIAGGPRAESRAERGMTDDDDPFAAHRAMMDAEEARTPRAYIEAEVVEPAEPSSPPAKRPPALEGADTVDSDAEFIKAANAKAARTAPRHT